MKKSFRILDELSKAEVHLGNPCEKIPHSISDLECDPRVYFNGKASLAQYQDCLEVLLQNFITELNQRAIHEELFSIRKELNKLEHILNRLRPKFKPNHKTIWATHIRIIDLETPVVSRKLIQDIKKKLNFFISSN